MMTRELPLTAWFCIALIIVIFVALNISLLTAWRARNQQRPPAWLQSIAQSLSAPWAEEDKHLQELSQRTARLRESQKPTAEGTPHEQN
ncbi:MAG: hypothetical protein HPY45_01085 [Anaerolineae bacterium]|nr:hypothetical protein [Anaerolineae bacterium]